jgi:hypothetical protein
MTTSAELRQKKEQVEGNIEKVTRSNSADMLAGWLVIAAYEIAEQIAELREALGPEVRREGQ